MHSTHRRQPDRRSRRSELPANAPHFFKVVDSVAVEQQKLGLPKKFVRKHGNDLSNLVFLKVPNGAVWQVQLMKVDGKVWLNTGWTEFVEFYSIRFGHFIVFRYEGDSHFNVLIFDTTACEIEYPFKAIHGEAQEAEANNSLKVPKIEEYDNGVLVENKKRKERKSSLYSQPCEMRNTRSKSCSGLKRAKLNPDVDSTQKISEISKVPVKECNEAMAGTQKHMPLAVPEHITAVDRANAFKSKNPFCIVIMFPSYVSGCRMNLPLGFAKRHFTRRQNSVILRISDDERTWSIKFVMRASYANLTLGWRTFVHDNHLREGDVCVFELIKGIEHSFKVELFRVAEDAPCQLRKFTPSQRTDCILEVTEATEKRRKVIHVDSAGNGCRIDETGMSNSQNWFVKKELRLSQDKFKESIKHEETVGAKVECSTPMISREKFLEGLQGKTRALEEAELPFFKAVLTTSYLARKYLGVPRHFVAQHIGKVSQTTMLRISNRSWPVRLSVYGRLGRSMFTTGWIEFVKDNTLQAGDVCVFELIKGIETVFEVSIFRCVGLLK